MKYSELVFCVGAKAVCKAIEAGATHLAVDYDGSVYAFKKSPTNIGSTDAIGWLRSTALGAKAVGFVGSTNLTHGNWRELVIEIPGLQ